MVILYKKNSKKVLFESESLISHKLQIQTLFLIFFCITDATRFAARGWGCKCNYTKKCLFTISSNYSLKINFLKKGNPPKWQIYNFENQVVSKQLCERSYSSISWFPNCMEFYEILKPYQFF